MKSQRFVFARLKLREIARAVEFIAMIDSISDPHDIKIITSSYNVLEGSQAVAFLENCAFESGFDGNVGQWVAQLKHPERTHFLYDVTKTD